MMPYFSQYFGNANSRSHSFGWQAEAAVEEARKSVATLIGCNPQEIVFTSGATEACNLALRGALEMYAAKGNHIITTKVEHKAVMDTCKVLEEKGAKITWLNVSEQGSINLAELEASITKATILIAIMYANNETGVLFPVKEIGEIAQKHGVLFFTDATQAVGKIAVDVIDNHISLMAFSSHKLYGPKGAGALYVRRKNPRLKITPQITGGGQENDRRSGTLNVAGIVGFGKACALCNKNLEAEAQQLKELRDKLQRGLLQIEASYLNGDENQRLPHIVNISFKGLNSSQLLSVLHKTLAISSGSACTSGSLEPSFVLKAMGLEDDRARGALRFSIGRLTTAEEIEYGISHLKQVVNKLRSESYAWQLAQKEKIH